MREFCHDRVIASTTGTAETQFVKLGLDTSVKYSCIAPFIVAKSEILCESLDFAKISAGLMSKTTKFPK